MVWQPLVPEKFQNIVFSALKPDLGITNSMLQLHTCILNFFLFIHQIQNQFGRLKLAVKQSMSIGDQVEGTDDLIIPRQVMLWAPYRRPLWRKNRHNDQEASTSNYFFPTNCIICKLFCALLIGYEGVRFCKDVYILAWNKKA